MTLLGTVRGIPQLYYGSEIGMAGDKNKGDADIRQDFPGGWKNDAINAFTKEGRTKDQEAYHSFTKKVFNYRKKSAALKTGKTLQFVPENNVYVYFRYTDNETIMVVINNSKEQQAVSLDRFQELLGNVKNGSDILSNKMIDFSKKNIEIAGKSSLIIELKK
jgi:glycosidase